MTRLAKAHPPARIRQLSGAAALVAVALIAVLTVEIGHEKTGLTLIGDQAAPEVVAASDLYFALNDMDAQVANVLLVGDDQNLGFTRAQALTIFEQRRQQVDRDVQRAASAATDPTTRATIDQVLDGLGGYEALAAQTILLDQQAPHPAGHPSAATLAEYRQATDLLKTRLLPAAQHLIDEHSRALENTYQAQRHRIGSVRTLVMALGVILIGILGALQIYLARRFRRLVNPALVAATAVTTVGLFIITGLLGDEMGHLQVAKKDAFDSILALTQARAISYDANADESRYLVDPDRANQYQQAFEAASQQLVELPDATLNTWDRDLATAIAAYRNDHQDIGWAGLLGVELRNITFNGERGQAETTLARYQTYQLDDRRIRALATSGHLNDAIAFCTSYAPGASNYAFDQYDQSLAALIAINQHAFDQSISRGEHQLAGRTAWSWAGCVTVIALLTLGLRPRLAEYR